MPGRPLLSSDWLADEAEGGKKYMTLEEAIEMAAKDLPEGYEIKVRVERGSAWVVLCDRDGCEEAIDETDMTFAEMVAAAVESANEAAERRAQHES